MRAAIRLCAAAAVCFGAGVLSCTLLLVIAPIFGRMEQDFFLDRGTLGSFWSNFDAAAAAHQARARALFEYERPRIMRSAATLPLRAYWARTAELASKDDTYYTMIYKRMLALNQLLDEGKDGFRIEKDKCAMYRYFTRNGLPMAPLFDLPTRDLEGSSAYLRALLNNTRWPVFVKMCHLTQVMTRPPLHRLMTPFIG